MRILNLIMVVGARLDDPQRPTGGGGLVRPAQWRHCRRGRSSPELRSTWLWCSIFGVFSSYGTGGVRGTHQLGLLPAGASRAGRATVRCKPQPSAAVGERSKGRLTTRLGQTGVAWKVEHRRRVDGARGVSHAAW
jgi:hypothetical protein